jgi:[protein-PII] uridylyltransferase
MAKTGHKGHSGLDEFAGLKELHRIESDKIRQTHFAGAGGMDVVRANTGLMDGLLVSVFDTVCEKMGLNLDTPGWALIAVGGYGRAELNPGSDVDIMFLHPDGTPDGGEGGLAIRVLHAFWDIGLNLGYSVREVSDCVRLARTDFTIMTSMVESRFLCGDKAIYDDFSASIKKGFGKKAVEDFIKDKLRERAGRRKKHGHSVFLREPNIKEGAGGLRDIHTAMWIARVKYGLTSIEALTDEGLIRPADLKKLIGAKDYLLRIRNGLHYIIGHKQDVLTYDLQVQTAADFGYRSIKGRMPVETFMRVYYLRARGVYEASQQIVENAIDKNAAKRWFFLPPSRKNLDGGFYIMGRSVCHDNAAGPGSRLAPREALQAFRLMQTKGMSFSRNLRTAVEESVGRIKPGRDGYAGSAEVFLKILSGSERLYETLDLMHRTKVLGRMLPEFGKATALVQHDMYHRYTVDEHSLIAIKKLEDLNLAQGGAYPEFREAMRRVEDRRVLILAALLHDCGKALGKGHAETGAVMAGEAALRLGLGEAAAEGVEFLVRNHLMMAHISQRRELSDRYVIERFCRIVSDRGRLDMLYLLTYADMSAVGPDVFNAWRRTLLKELYERAAEYLSDERSAAAHQAMRYQKRLDEFAELVVSGGTGTREEAAAFASNFPDMYLLSVTPRKAAGHFSEISGLGPDSVIIRAEHDDERGLTELTVMLHDMMGVFSVIAGAIAYSGMNILGAQVFTGNDGVVIDTFTVGGYDTEPSSRNRKWKRLEGMLMDVLTGVERVGRIVPPAGLRPAPKRLAEASVEVVVDNEASDRYTVIEVFAGDRPGLLFDIARTLNETGCYVSSARIATSVDRVVDVFYVRDIFRFKIDSRDKVRAITERLTEAVKGGGG